MAGKTQIKFCGLRRPADIEAANSIAPEYIGFVFAKKSKRYVTFKEAEELKKLLSPDIKAVGVFVSEEPEVVADLLERGVIDIAQLHGGEDEAYIAVLRKLTGKPLVKAFKIKSREDLEAAAKSSADMILLDAGEGDGKVFDWSLIGNTGRDFFLAGGLDPDNVRKAVTGVRPFAVDVSSGIETDGFKDREKMERFAAAVREAENGVIL